MGHADAAAGALAAASDAAAVDAAAKLQAAIEAGAALRAAAAAFDEAAKPAVLGASQAARDALDQLASAGDAFVSGELGAMATRLDEDCAALGQFAAALTDHINSATAQLDEAANAATQLASLLGVQAKTAAARLQAGG